METRDTHETLSPAGLANLEVTMTNANACVFYWVGGTARGEWRRADAGTRADVERMGYVAVDGSTSIGAPDGPPSPQRISAALGQEVG